MKAGDELAGDVVFELYDTFGFPVDLTALIAGEQSLKVDEAGFQALLEVKKTAPEKQARSPPTIGRLWPKAMAPPNSSVTTTPKPPSFLPPRGPAGKKKTFVQAVFDRSPFYPEGGGQVGDRGVLASESGETFQVLDTKKENNLIVHVLDRVPQGSSFEAKVDVASRDASARNHSATTLFTKPFAKCSGRTWSRKDRLSSPTA